LGFAAVVAPKTTVFVFQSLVSKPPRPLPRNFASAGVALLRRLSKTLAIETKPREKKKTLFARCSLLSTRASRRRPPSRAKNSPPQKQSRDADDAARSPPSAALRPNESSRISPKTKTTKKTNRQTRGKASSTPTPPKKKKKKKEKTTKKTRSCFLSLSLSLFSLLFSAEVM
jgi:hypothetical protein